MRVIDKIKAIFILKGDKAKILDMYLGGSIAKSITDIETKCCTLSSEKYIKSSIDALEEKYLSLD